LGGGYEDAFVAKLNPAGSALVYSTYLGGSYQDFGYAIAVDSSGNAYVTGWTQSSDFPTANPLQANLRGQYGNAFVAKLNAAGSALVYSTYLGGSYQDFGYAIAVDSSGNAYVTGVTDSSDFPTHNPLQPHLGQVESDNAFVTKLNPAGSALVYSTYLGGSVGNVDDEGYAIAVDSSGNAYVAGYTRSSDFPTHHPLQAHLRGNYNAFVAKLNAAGSALIYSTYLGGSYQDFGYAIAVDSSGNANVTGQTFSTDFPTANPLQPNLRGFPNAFVAKLNAAGSALVYSTYLGGSGDDVGYSIAVDSSGNAYVAGQTSSSDFPTVNPLQANKRGILNAFVAKLNAAGSALIYSTYLGGSYQDWGNAIAVDSSGNAYVTGQACSSDFPTHNPLQAHLGGVNDCNAFVAKIAPSNVPAAVLSPSSLAFAPQKVGTSSATQTVTVTNLGSEPLSISGISASAGFAETDNCSTPLSPSGNCSISVTFTPTAVGEQNGTLTITDNDNGVNGSQQTVALSGTGLTPAAATLSATSESFGNQVINTTSTARSVTLTSTGTTSLSISGITITGVNAGDFKVNTCPASLAPKAKCFIKLTYTPTVLGAETASLVVTDNAPSSPQTVALSGTGVLPVVLSATSLSFGNLDEGVSSAAKTITMTNYQEVTLTGIGVSTGNTDYTQTNTCGTSLAAGKKCTITVKFNPSIIGTDDATLSISDSASNSPQTVAMTGKGLAPVSLTPTSKTYASQTVGTTSLAKVITLTSYLSTTLSSIAISATGDFAVSSTTCTTTLAAKGKCTIDVVFKPTATGTRTGTLKVSDSAANSPQTSTLTGTGK